MRLYLHNIQRCGTPSGAVLRRPAGAGLERREPVMPFKSQAQRRKFAQLLVEGKISGQTFEEWNRETGSQKLPDHVKKKRRVAKRKTAKTRR
jgi:hypothetical protein